MSESGAAAVVRYHQATKHHFHRYARSAGYLDWRNQPNPFRLYEKTTTFRLPFGGRHPEPLFRDLAAPPDDAGLPLNPQHLGRFLELSLAISAWKAAGASRWALRINPSSGNLHPTESHLILPALQGIESGAYHYTPLTHALEQRSVLPADLWAAVRGHYGGEGFLLALTTIFWRESWKYGERAYRYCNLDVGHALAALAYAARLNNWRLHLLSGAGDHQIEVLLGFDRTAWPSVEEEAVDLLCWVDTAGVEQTPPRDIPAFLLDAAAKAPFYGSPSVLSAKPVDWSAISHVHGAARKGETKAEADFIESTPPAVSAQHERPASAVIRQRRSAVRYNPRQAIAAETFFTILDRTRPRRGSVPFNVGLGPCRVDLLVFVHRVEGLTSGLYFLDRMAERATPLPSAFKKSFLWQSAHPQMPFFRLQEGDVAYAAMEASCHQDIAGQSAFAVSMLAEFKVPIERTPYVYRHLHWECGLIGQVLYLEAEAHGIRGTGIGCFFDDAVHSLLGLGDTRFQCLYHFTVGHPVEDDRLSTLPPYHHLQGKA